MPDFFSAYHDKNGGGDRVVTDGDLYLLDVTDVEVDDEDTVQIADAHVVDTRAHRRRPTQLVVGMALVACMVLTEVINAVLILRNPWKYAAINVGALDELAESQINLLALRLTVGLVSAILVGLVIVTAALTWQGHPRARIILMTALSLNILVAVADIAHSGTSHILLMTLIGSSLNVLALLALSARACHQWVRERKRDRIAATLELAN